MRSFDCCAWLCAGAAGGTSIFFSAVAIWRILIEGLYFKFREDHQFFFVTSLVTLTFSISRSYYLFLEFLWAIVSFFLGSWTHITKLVHQRRIDEVKPKRNDFNELKIMTIFEDLLTQNRKILRTKYANYLCRLNVVKATIEAMSITLETLAAVQLLSAPSTQNTVVPTPVTISLCKMKHLELPTFSWELREWRSFSEQFQFTVGNADFPDI